MDHNQEKVEKVVTVTVYVPDREDLPDKFCLDSGKVETVNQAKEEIEAVTRIPVNKQLVYIHNFSLCRFVTESMQNMKFFYPGSSPTLHLVLFTKIDPPRTLSLDFSLFDENRMARKVNVMINSDATLMQLMQRLDEVVGIPPCRQSMLVDVCDEFEITVPINPGNDLKLEDVIPEGTTENVIFLSRITDYEIKTLGLTVDCPAGGGRNNGESESVRD